VRSFVLAVCSVFATVGTEVGAQQRQNCTGPQIGTWKLESYTIEDLATGQTTDFFGARPSGYMSYGPDCRMNAILIQEGRRAPASLVPTEAERIELYGGLIAYAGAYSIEGDKVSHHIDASWNQAWTGTTQVRQFTIDGKTLYIRTMPSKNALTGREASSVLTWTKVE
jgi:lipocalin-like protein